MTLNSRQRKIAKEILTSSRPLLFPDQFLGSGAGADEARLSADLKRISDYCASFGVEISCKPGLYHPVCGEQARLYVIDRLDEAEREASSSARGRLGEILYDCMFSEPIPTLDEWSERLNYSRPTISSDVQNAMEWFNSHNLKLVGRSRAGYSLFYSEADLRAAAASYYYEFYQDEVEEAFLYAPEVQTSTLTALLPKPAIEAAKACLNTILKKTDVSLRNQDLLNLSLYLAVALTRCERGFNVTLLDEKRGDHAAGLYRIAAGAFSAVAADLGLRLPSVEPDAFAERFVAAQAGDSPDNADYSVIAMEIATDIANTAEKVLCIPLSRDVKFIERMTNHILQTVRKLKSGFSFANLDVASFVKQYPLEYGLGLQFCDLVSDRLGVRVPESEGAFVAMYIAAELERITNTKNRRKRAVLVSINALSASTLLYWQLTNQFSSQLKLVQSCTYNEFIQNPPDNIDLIISTVNMEATTAPCLVISPILSQRDIKNIKAFLDSEDSASSELYTLSDMLFPELIFIGEDAAEPEQLLRKIGGILFEKGYVKEGYVEALIANEKMFGSALDTTVPIALPHAAPENSQKACIAVVLAKNEIPFKLIGRNEFMKTRLIVFPVLILNTSAGFSFYSFIAALKNKKIAESLLKCATPEEVCRLFGSI